MFNLLAIQKKETQEAAMIDGANRWQSIWNVTVPLLGSTIRTTVYLSVLGSLTQLNLVWIMTRGGPINASEFMATYMYRFSFIRFQLGYNSAVALVMLAICLVFSVFSLSWNTQIYWTLGTRSQHRRQSSGCS